MMTWVGISFVLATLTASLMLLRRAKRQYKLHPELVRKLLHVGMGLTTLTFPWLFSQTWPVLLLAGITIPGLLLLRRSKRAQAHFGGVIDGVGRNESLGEIYFPLGVAGVFILSGGEPLSFSISILLLTLADALAALIGLRYGRTQYTTTQGYKSVEGSLAFFGMAFVSVWMPLTFFSPFDAGQSALIAVVLGVLVTLIEAVSCRGFDNLSVPVSGLLLLNLLI
jgi:phytol kinase